MINLSICLSINLIRYQGGVSFDTLHRFVMLRFDVNHHGLDPTIDIFYPIRKVVVAHGVAFAQFVVFDDLLVNPSEIFFAFTFFVAVVLLGESNLR